jgi:hypothetical protein
MTEDLCRQLVALGIPLERHNAVSLSNMFPPELKVGNFDLSESDIAEVLIAFVKRGLVSLALPGDTIAMRRAAHGHICHFYRNQEEMVTMTASFLEEGLRAGERCLWVLPEWLNVERARTASRAARRGLLDGEVSGRLVYLTEREVYWDKAGILRTAPGIIGFWLEQEQNARTEGFEGIRITGDGTPLVSTDSWRSAVDYERLADAAFKGRRIVAFCTYCLQTISPHHLAEVLSGHDTGFVRRGEGWDQIHSGAGVQTAIQFLQAVPQ